MTPASFSLFTLGELRLVSPAGPVLAGRRKELVLLACVARRAPKAVSRDELAALLWGERDEDKARQSLRHALHQLRRALDNAIEVTNDDVRVADTMIDVDASLLRDHPRARMILTVHDELLFEAPEDEADEVASLVRKTMAGAVTLRVPLDVDVGMGHNWKEAKS